jgi:hypothetical protein
VSQKILILTTIPCGLRLDREIRDIAEAIRRASRRDLFEICIRAAVRPQDIRRAIAEDSPQIVHFCGHGMLDGSLLLEDDAGNNKPITSEGLAALFKLHTDYVKCVLLNACYSAKIAFEISQYIDYVIGMNQEINDKSAIAFAQGFYDALGYENQYYHYPNIFQRAFDEGLVAIQLENNSNLEIPVLHKKSITKDNESSSFFSVEILQNFKNNSDIVLESNTDQSTLEIKENYTKLENLLKAMQWKEADYETYQVMLQVVGRKQQGWMRKEELLNFPDTHLKLIDSLWRMYSKNRFGFSVQQQVLRSIGGKPDNLDSSLFRKFAEHIGWRYNNEWLKYEDFNISLDKVGHLPSFGYSIQRWDEWEPSFRSFLLRVSNCMQ